MDTAPRTYHDHHTHPLLYAAFRSGVDLSDANSFEEATDLIGESEPTGKIIVAHHWRSNRFEIPEIELEKLPPVAVFNFSLHGLRLNSQASTFLQRAYGDSVLQVSNQDWFERNFNHVLNWFAMMGGSPRALIEFYQYLESLGIQSAEELLLVGETEIDWFEEAGLIDRTKFWAAPETVEKLSIIAKTKVFGCKLFTDGAFGARTAAVQRPYLGDSENTGMLIYSDAELCSTIEKCSSLKTAIAIHAIGDVAIEQTLGALEKTQAKTRFEQIRIEHAQLITKQQALRAKDLGITLSMQPNFNSDSTAYADRLPTEYLQNNNPFRMLIDEVGFHPGADLIFGSDGMPHGFELAWDEVNEPAFEGQRLTREELENGYSHC